MKAFSDILSQAAVELVINEIYERLCNISQPFCFALFNLL
jgi:hypothetical protein